MHLQGELSMVCRQSADEHTEWLTGLYIQRRCKLCIIISPVVNGRDFGVSWGFSELKKQKNKKQMPML